MLRRFMVGLALILAIPFPAAAQRGQQIFDFLLQGAQQEIYRQQQRDFERQHRRELERLYQQFVAQWHACHGGDVAACDAALSYPNISFKDRQAVLARRNWIVAAEQEVAERAHRQRIEAAERERQELERQRAEAAWQRQRAEQERRDAEAQLLALREQQSWSDAATLLWPWGAVGGLIAVSIMLLRTFVLPERVKLAWAGMAALFRRQQASSALRSEVPPEPTASPATPPPLPATKPDAPRDTAGAIAALELALAYIEEVRDADRPGLEDTAERKNQLNTLALAAKQLDLAAKLDPDAILQGSTDDIDYRFTINELEAEALLLEGLTHQIYDLKRAIPSLVKATQHNPHSSHAFYVLGLTHAANMSKAKAVAAFEHAVALDPKNIAYRKELNRAQSLSGGEIAAYKATRAGEKVFDAGIKTANAGIMAWNIFAVIWNILTFPLRLVFGLFRILRLT